MFDRRDFVHMMEGVSLCTVRKSESTALRHVTSCLDDVYSTTEHGLELADWRGDYNARAQSCNEDLDTFWRRKILFKKP